MAKSARGRVPPRTAAVRGPVGEDTSIRWDSWGVAHVRAASLRDGYVALGYAMAQERLWQLDYMRRQARGELAAILGPSAVASDRGMRTLGLRRTAELDLLALDPEVREVLDALTAGINLWTEQVKTLPIEFEQLGYRPTPWRPEDSIAVWKYRWWYNSGRLDQVVLAELAQRILPPELDAAFMAAEAAGETLVPHDGERAAAGARGADPGEGSNNWAVAASKTTTGRAVLCSDPHNPFSAPSQWFEAQLTIGGPGGFDVIGAFYLGVPGVYIGRNRRVAWGVTNHVIPMRDLYVEQVNPANPDEYREGAGWRRFEVDDETIEVKGGAPIDLKVRRTVRGPVVSGGTGLVSDGLLDERPTLSLRWVGHDRGTGIDASLAFHRAGSVAEMTEALRKWPCPPLNFSYADADGRVAFHVASRVPRRRVVTQGLRPTNDPAHAWDGDVPFDELPQVIEPPRGWVATANNPPWRADDPSQFRRDYVASAHWSDGYRMQRIRERLTEKPKLSPDEIASIQAEVDYPRGRELVPALLDLLKGETDAEIRAAARQLEQWDRQYTIDSVGASVWSAFWDAWRAEIAAARFPAAAVQLAGPQAGAVAARLLRQASPLPLGEGQARPERSRRGEDVAPVAWFPDGTDVGAAVLKAFRRGTARLKGQSGSEQPSGWRWGKLHTVTFHHPLGGDYDTGPSPTSGGPTVRAAGFGPGGFGPDGHFRVTSGSTYRFVAELGPGGSTRSVQNLGQSAHPSSPHYRDQNRLWLEDRYKPLWMDDADVAANLEGTTTLHPDG